tara:strand:- start:151 stop:819 length:669 start_codon:yes stop_codon:yes gene_type:complete
MSIVYNYNETKLVKKGKNRWELTVPWEGETKKFWVNFPFNLLKIIKQEKVGKNDDKKLTIKAASIKPLSVFLKEKKNRLSYDDAIEMLFDLGNQLQTLERFYMGIPFLDIKDIIVVDDKHYFYLNDSKLIDIKNNQLEIDEPYKKSMFFSPELENISSLPAQISYKSGIYSVASLVIFCLLNDNVTSTNKMTIMAPLNTSKLYWALLRMLEEDPEDRFYLII